MLIVVGVLSLAISGPTIERERLPRGEYYALMLFALAGMMLMATASDLLVIFLALEVLSLAVYVLTGIRRDSPAATEAALKYFLLGAFSSAFFLYGIAFTYGLTGTHAARSHRRAHGRRRRCRPAPMQLLAIGVPAGRFAFKVSAVPFHMWTPDAYEGAPPAVTGFMSTGVKAAAFAAFVRVFLSAFEPLHGRVDAAGLGDRRGDDDRRDRRRRGAVERQADAGLLEHRARRLPAGGAGVGQRLGKGAILFYLLAYAVTNLGAFGVIALLETPTGRTIRCATTPGCGTRHPMLAALMTMFLLSLGGFPPFGGFIAKWYVFSRRDRGRRNLAGDHRRADQRRLGLLLPAHRRHDVHDAER